MFLLKKILILLFFLLLPTSANALTPEESIATSSSTENNQIVATNSAVIKESDKMTPWEKFWSWITAVFIKNNYVIKQRDPVEKTSEMTNYDSEVSSAGTRLTSKSSQDCFKGDIIKKHLDTKPIAHICLDSNVCTVSTDSSCAPISLKDLAHYFVQINQNFYCNDQNNFVEIDNDTIEDINNTYKEDISDNMLSCYQAIYDDLYLVPRGNINENEINSQKIVKTPIPASSQNDSDDTLSVQNKLNQNLSPNGTSYGLDGLRPTAW